MDPKKGSRANVQREQEARRANFAVGSKLMATVLGAAAATLAVWIAPELRAVASVQNDKADIIALNEALAKSFDNKDIEASLAYYSDDQDALFYEDDTFELKGREALRNYFQAFFTAADIQQTLGPISVAVDGDVAAAHYTIQLSWRDQSGAHRELARYTQILKKSNGKWLIWHEHSSLPYDPSTGKAVFEAKS